VGQEFSRTERIADFLQQELAKLLLHSVRDPRAECVSITAVEVSRDLRYAKVFFTKLGLEDAKSAEDVTRVLDKAAGFLRSEISRDSTLRTVPKLTFKFDESVGRGRHMEALLGKARASDSQNQDASGVDET
jgi:ribosome-binding factor A